jgi:excisionase family DNA binding protein
MDGHGPLDVHLEGRMIETTEPLLLRVPEAAWRLGLSRSTLYELIAAGELRVIKVGRAVRIPAAELAAWVERQSVAK